MANCPTGTTILMNMEKGEGTIELVIETGIHLLEFWGRGDMKVEYLDFSSIPKGKFMVVDSDQFPREYSQEKLIQAFGEKSESLSKTTKRLVLTTPVGVIKQTVKKLVGLLVYGKRFDPDGLYTYYYDYHNWDFYVNEK
jgi:hypothetical protein